MSRTKGKSAKNEHPPARRHLDEPESEAHEHPGESDRKMMQPPVPDRSKLPKGAAERRRMSYGYRTSPRGG